MKIDAHHHLWDLTAVHYPWLMAQGVSRFFGDPSTIQRDYLMSEFRTDAAEFDASVHIQVGAESGWREAQWVQSIADATPDWPLKQVAFVDLTAPDVDAQLDRLCALPSVVGVRQIVGRAPGEDAVTGTNDLLDDPGFTRGLKAVQSRDLSFDLQLIPELYPAMARVLDAVPDLPVALCHAGSPHDRTAKGIDAWAQALKILSARPQVTCKLSGLGMFDHSWSVESLAPLIDILVDQFGQTRLMFGSNFPVDSLYSDYATLLSAFETRLPKAMHGDIFGQTAQRFYRF